MGRILFWKRTRPTPRKKSTRAFRLRPGPPTAQRARAAALSLWKPSPRDRGGANNRKENASCQVQPSL
nr:MAG TPA: hypothetical protein [Caudoviricetes sp.]